MKEIILASNSPRRRELLKKLDIEFNVVISNIEEEINSNISPYELACNLAHQKAKDVLTKIKDKAIIIAADTVVIHNEVLGKPKTKQEAYEMLKSLSGTTHEVVTGLVVIDSYSYKEIIEYEVTKVSFREIENEEIYRYIETGEPMDKAGAYGIQGKASLFIEKINGDYYNVMGLPVYRLGNILKNNFNINLL